MIADVALVTQDEAPLVVGFAATLAHRAVQTPPAFRQYHGRELGGRRGEGAHGYLLKFEHWILSTIFTMGNTNDYAGHIISLLVSFVKG